MKRAIGVCLALAMLAVPATAIAKPVKPTKADRTNAAKDCKAERAEIGVEAFREKYGANKGKRNAFGKCVSQGARAEARERRAERRNAAKDCRAEREEVGVEAFREKYGSNKKTKRNAFGKCVSQTVRENREDEETEVEVEVEA
ncbi:MAG: hypothetical protein WD993_06795 [Thermoleophilaceae bacterium]